MVNYPIGPALRYKGNEVTKVKKMEWKRCNSQIEWEDLIGRCVNTGLGHLWEWGEFKIKMGNPVSRHILIDPKGSKQAGIQLIEKFHIGSFFGVYGGPKGIARTAEFISLFNPSLFKKLVNKQFIYFRTDQADGISCGMKNVLRRISAPYDLKIDLTPDINTLLANLSKNWRHNLRRAEKRNLEIYWGIPPISDLQNIHKEHVKIKGYGQCYSERELQKLIETFSKRAVGVYCCENDKIISFRIAVLFADKAFDFLASSTMEARSNYSNYLLQWLMIKKLKELNIQIYDLCGGDPIRNPSVFQFKKSAGAKETVLGPEMYYAG